MNRSLAMKEIVYDQYNRQNLLLCKEKKLKRKYFISSITIEILTLVVQKSVDYRAMEENE